MFRIRKIHDAVSPANRDMVEQIKSILTEQFPLATKKEINKLPGQLEDPVRHRYVSNIFIAEDARNRIKGFALMLYFTDIKFCYLEYISTAPGQTGGGIGSVLYERVREEAIARKAIGLIYEVLPDEPHLCLYPELLKQNIARLRFYERYGARPILNKAFNTPVTSEDNDLFFLVLDDLGREAKISRLAMHRIVRAILVRKYDSVDENYLKRVQNTFQDNPIRLREPRYTKQKKHPAVVKSTHLAMIPVVVNTGHDIHHVKDRGYVEAPVRINSIQKELAKLNLFKYIKPKQSPERHITAVHDKELVQYIRRICANMPVGKSTYPVVFPMRNHARPPKDLEIRAGYYCIDTFTPINHNAYRAARGAVNCAITAADEIIGGKPFAYALVRPPGHHAERRAIGGFCYFNSAAIAANYLSYYGKVAVLDIDFHHGNGTQDIFYKRSDVLTVSIHGHPNEAYPFFSGFEDEVGEDQGRGYNINYPLPEKITSERYHSTLKRALQKIRKFDPIYLVISLGFDTAKNDPTGTWQLSSEDFRQNGVLLGSTGLPTLIVQEGGYNNRNLGINARYFFTGLWEGYVKKAGL